MKLEKAADTANVGLRRTFAKHEEQILTALRIRVAEDRLLQLFAEGELHGTVHTCVGQELLPVVLAGYLGDADFVCSNHRGHGHYLSFTKDMHGLFAEIMGSSDGASGGYGGSQHLLNAGFVSNGVQGGMTPIAAGIAHALVSETGRGLCACFVGDGTLGQGVFYESLNIASKWKLPVLYIVEDNGYAQSTSAEQTVAGSVAGRAAAFEVEYFHARTLDLSQLEGAVRKAVDFVRNTGGPAMLHVETQRLNAHSKGDDNRDDDELAKGRASDLINRFTDAGLITRDQIAAITNEIDDIIEECRGRNKLSRVPHFMPVHNTAVSFDRHNGGLEDRIAEQINAALGDMLESDQALTVIGEDIEDSNQFTPKPYGGAFKVTKDLSRDFPGQIHNTPISEAAIVGLATGRALRNKKTIVEIMFGDFCTLVVDQVHQHAAKFSTMFGREIPIPLLIRTPMGGRRGYGPTHSQSIERLFLGVQNLLVLAPNHRIDVYEMYRQNFDFHAGPTFVIENKLLYGLRGGDCAIPGYRFDVSNEAHPCLRIRPIRFEPKCTIVTYGYGLALAEMALVTLLKEHEIFCEVICPTALSPFNIWPISESVTRTGRVVTVEEGATFGAFGSEVISQLANRPSCLEGVRRLGNNTIIPCSIDAELELMPSSESITSAVLELVRS